MVFFYMVTIDAKRIALLSQSLHLVTQIVKKKDEVSVREATFSLSPSSFQNLIYPLDGRSIMSGLGYDYGIDPEVAQSSAALHYNGEALARVRHSGLQEVL